MGLQFYREIVYFNNFNYLVIYQVYEFSIMSFLKAIFKKTALLFYKEPIFNDV